jgi:hypothetical protein
MDLGDWQELSRLRFENHVWHRGMAAILETVERPGVTSNAIIEAVERSVASLNDHLVRLHRRPLRLH